MDITEVCNLALLRVGVSTSVADVMTEVSKEAKMLRSIYPLAIDTVLRDFPWNFATRRVTLALSGDEPTNWEYSYAYPSDCLMVDAIVVEGLRKPRNDQRIQYEVGYDGSAKKIYTDLEDAEIIYRARVTDLSQWDALALSGLSWYIAAELAMPLSARAEIASLCRNAYAQTINDAAARNMNERMDGPEPDAEWLAVRFG